MKSIHKKLIVLSFILCLILAGCGVSSNTGSSSASGAPSASSDTASADSSDAQEPAGDIKILVGATPAPHAEILQAVQPVLAEQGYTLEIIEFTDYVLPNKALDSRELDANFFQHKPYLDNFNEQNGTKLISAVAIHFEPLGIYYGKTEASKDQPLLGQIPEGAEIAVPNDTTNEARALQLLEANGIIALREGAGLEATALDVVENPLKVKILEIEAAQLPRSLDDVDFAVVNGNYALDAGITDRIIATEASGSEGAQTFANVVAVRAGDEERPEIQALIAALQSDTIKAYIEDTYAPFVVPVF